MHGRHSREGGNPFIKLQQAPRWVPAFAGTTLRRSANPCARKPTSRGPSCRYRPDLGLRRPSHQAPTLLQQRGNDGALRLEWQMAGLAAEIEFPHDIAELILEPRLGEDEQHKIVGNFWKLGRDFFFLRFLVFVAEHVPGLPAVQRTEHRRQVSVFIRNVDGWQHIEWGWDVRQQRAQRLQRQRHDFPGDARPFCFVQHPGRARRVARPKHRDLRRTLHRVVDCGDGTRFGGVSQALVAPDFKLVRLECLLQPLRRREILLTIADENVVWIFAHETLRLYYTINCESG